MSESEIQITDVVQYLTCNRRYYFSCELPRKQVSQHIQAQAKKMLSRHWKEKDLEMEELYPAEAENTDPLFVITKGSEKILLFIDCDPLLVEEINYIPILLQYAMKQWGFQKAVAVQLLSGNIVAATAEKSKTVLREIPEKLLALQNSLQAPKVREDTSLCEACPVLGLCLPFCHDPGEKTRTLLPKKESGLPLIVNIQRGKVRKRKAEIVVENMDGEVVQANRFHEVSSIVLYGDATITTPLLQECNKRDIPVHYHDAGGWYQGSFQPITGRNIMARVRQYQVAMDLEACLSIVRGMVVAKIHNSRTLLMRSSTLKGDANSKTLQELKNQAMKSTSLSELRGIEGAAARVYFQNFSSMLKSKSIDFSFTHRNRRPPKDPINAMLSFGYACLYREVTDALLHAGLDPWMGFLHVPQTGRASLALDMMEEFRSIIVDSIVLKMVNNQQLTKEDFLITSKGAWFEKKAKALFLREFERKMKWEIRHPLLQVKLSYRRVIQAQIQLLIKAISEPKVDYTGFIVR